MGVVCACEALEDFRQGYRRLVTVGVVCDSQGKDVLISLREKGVVLPSVVAMTANTTAEDLASYASAGFSATLSKPFTQAHLKSVLSDATSAPVPSTC